MRILTIGTTTQNKQFAVIWFMIFFSRYKLFLYHRYSILSSHSPTAFTPPSLRPRDTVARIIDEVRAASFPPLSLSRLPSTCDQTRRHTCASLLQKMDVITYQAATQNEKMNELLYFLKKFPLKRTMLCRTFLQTDFSLSLLLNVNK